jgi:hypothetical protein
VTPVPVRILAALLVDCAPAEDDVVLLEAKS